MAEYGFVITAENLVSVKMAEAEASIHSFGTTAKVETKEAAESFNLMGERMSETFKNLKGLLLTGLGITALFEGWEFIEKSKEAFEGLEKQVVRIQTVLKSTNFSAGFSSEDIQNQARELNKHVARSRNEILEAQGTLLSAPSIRGNIFKEATQAVADYSAFFNTSMVDSAKQFTKVLNDPKQGMMRLVRMNIQLSDEQKKQIKNLEQQGHLAEAQEVILREIQKRFGGQARAFALTDAGKIQVAANEWQELQFKIGEIISRVEVSLIPSFLKFINTVKDAFSSSVIQFFIGHIKDLVTWTLKLLPIWLAYKVIMVSISAVTKAYAAAQLFLKTATTEATAATGEATVAMEGFSAAMASTGIGLLVVGIGLLIEKLIDVNSQFNASIEKITRLDELTNKANPTIKTADDSWTTYAFGKLSNKEKGILFNTTKTNEETAQGSIKENNTQRDAIANQIADAKKAYAKMPDYVGDTENQTVNQEKTDLGDKINSLSDNMRGLSVVNMKLHSATVGDEIILKDYTKQNEAIIAYNKLHPHHKKELIIATDPNGGRVADANNTSNLSGASGGLGQAKIVHITIGTFQQNNGVHDLKHQSEVSIAELTQLINNFSDSENQQ